MTELHASHRDFDPAQQETAERITTMLQTPEVLAGIIEFDPEYRGVVMGRCIDYVAVGLDGGSMSEYLEKLKATEPKDVHELYDTAHGLMVDQLTDELNISELENAAKQQRLFDHLTERLVVRGSVYHGFNGVFEDTVRQNGLSVENRAWDWEELDKVRELFTSMGHSKILGWGGVNSKGNIFVTEDPSGICRYATGSPEWFAQFTGESHSFPLEPRYNKQAFALRDYEAARQNITLLCQQLMSNSEEDIQQGRAYRNMTVDEMNEVLTFFETYWQRFAGFNSDPKLALIRRAAVDDDTPPFDSYADFQSIYEGFGEYPPLSLYIEHISQRNDLRVNEDITPEVISIADLPQYSEIFPPQAPTREMGSTAVTGSIRL